MEHLVEQNTPEWHDLRVGSIGASNIADATAKGKGKAMSAGKRNTIARMVAERMSGKYADVSNGFKSYAMERGSEMEDQARAAYEFLKDCTVRTCGLFTHPTIVGTHASPDGVVVENGQDVGEVEIKCPMPAAHLETLLKKEVPSQYKKQIQWQLECAGFDWCDYVSFSPDFPSGIDMIVIRVYRDDELISSMSEEVVQINAEVTEVIRSLHADYQIDAP